MIQVAMGTIVNGIAALITGEPFTVRMLTDSMDVIIYTGVISLGIANLLQFLGQPRVSSVTAAVACSFESVFGLTFGVILLGESL